MSHPFTTLLTTTLAIVLIPAASLQAQPNKARHHGPPDAEMRVAHLTRALELSDQQSADLLEVFQAVDEERRALRQQALLQMKPQICELRQATEEEINTILDDEQLVKLEEIKANHERGRGRRDWHAINEMDCSDA